MIQDIRLRDFIAHKDTKLEFGKGVTIFIGHNGSGKSSIIDAITFALFGTHAHTRKSNKNLIRRGANEALVQMRFSLNSKQYQATRTLSGSGTQSFSQLLLLADGDGALNRPIVGGERRQFGESMSSEVAKVLGLDYSKLCVAAVVQQGELVKIVDAQPREFKELLNGLIGIDRLDLAYETMRDVMLGFRERLRDETGYTDEEIPKIEKMLGDKEREKNDAESLISEFEEEKMMLEDKIAQLEKEIARLEPMMQKIQELHSREKLLVRHVSEKRSSMADEVARLEMLVKESRACLQVVGNRDKTRARIDMVNAELAEIQDKIEENERLSGNLRGFLECAGRLQIVDGRCPVCNSPVSRLGSMFDTSHIQDELKGRTEEKFALQRSRVELKREEQSLLESDRQIAAAEKFLLNNSITSADDLEKIESDLHTKQQDLARLPADEIATAGDDPMRLAVDGVSKSLAEEVLALRQQIKTFSQQQYSNARLEKDSLTRSLQDTNRKIGGYQKTLEDSVNAIDMGKKTIAKLQEAAEFSGILERIRSSIFSRDGPIGTSLRSWAMKVISDKASDYASLFNIGISRIELTEKTRDLSITCYGRQGEIDLDSLSGGEKVAAALALRLGIAYMMGSNKLDFVILDEPTTHLDEERRRALVRVISEAFRDGAGPLSQIIIITHDADIFQDSEVDRVFRFSMTADGSQVSQE